MTRPASLPLPLLLGLLVAVTGTVLGVRLLLQPEARAEHGAQHALSAPAGAPPQGHVITYCFEEPNSLNPFTNTGAVARRYVLAFTHEPLLDLDPTTGALRPALASAWQVDPDGLGFTVTLRQGVEFADGSSLTMGDVLFTHEVATSPDVVLGSIGDGLRLVRDVTVLPGTPPRLHIALQKRHFAAVRAVATSWIVVQRRFWLQQLAELARRQGITVPEPGQPGFGALLAQLQRDPGPGTGPYVFLGETGARPSWRRGVDLELTRNERHWRRHSEPGCWNLAGIRILFLGDEAARYSALRDGAIDFYSGPDLDGILAREAGLADDFRKVVYDARNNGPLLVQWNLRRPLLKEAAVRRALAKLFDRQGIVTLLQGNGRPAVAYSKPDEPGYPAGLEPYPFEPAVAGRELRAAGFGGENEPPASLTILAPAEDPLYRQVLDMATAAARDAGIELVARYIPYRTLMLAREGSDWDGVFVRMDFLNWIDPYDLFHSQAGGRAMGFANARADELLERARVELDDRERGRLLEELHLLVHEEQPVCFVVQRFAAMLVNAHLQNAEPGPLGLWPERFWVAPEHQRRPQ